MTSKTIVLVGFICHIFLYANSQVKSSKIDEFMGKSGLLLKKEFKPITNISGVEIKSLKITDLMSKSTISGARFEYVSYNDISYVAFLDWDEIDPLVKCINYIVDSALTSKPTIYTEVIYKSRSSIEVGCYWSLDKSTWRTYMEIMGHSVFLKPEDLPTMAILLSTAKSTIK